VDPSGSLPSVELADRGKDQRGDDNRPGVAYQSRSLGATEGPVAPHHALQPIIGETLRTDDFQRGRAPDDGAVSFDILNDQKIEFGAAQSGLDDAGATRHQRRERARMVDVRALRNRGGMVYRFFLARRITPAAACGDSEYFSR